MRHKKKAYSGIQPAKVEEMLDDKQLKQIEKNFFLWE